MPATVAAPRPRAPQGLIRSLVGIRGVLAIVVVLVHLAPFATAMTPEVGPVLVPLWHHGYVALDVFFVLSGFVVLSGYRATFARFPGWPTFGRFLWARLARFYPMHLAVLAVLVGAVLAGRAAGTEIPHGGNLTTDLLRQVTLTSGWGGAHALTWNGPVWSLSAEWFCYLLMPLIAPLVTALRTRGAAVAGFLVACAIPLAAYGVLGFDDPTITFGMPLPRALGAFVAGACLSRLTQLDDRLPALAGRWTGALLALALAAVVALSVAGAPTLPALPLLALVVLALSRQRGLVDRVLASRPALALAEISVTVFLVHVPWFLGASLVINPRTFPGAWGWLGWLLILAAVPLLGWLGLRLVERPAARVMGRMVRRPAKAPARPVAERTEDAATGVPGAVGVAAGVRSAD